MTSLSTDKTSRNVIFLVLVASLGYFVDIYDLLIFSIVRKASLLELGVKPADVLSQGLFIINIQVVGLLAGGILWGVLGDKLGRVKVLFGSIILYTLANFANGFVHSVDMYALIRFIAGVGLAGELGAGITLVTETLSKEKRGYGTMMVAFIGLFGAVAAATVAKNMGWRNAYFVGGGLGVFLLLLRVGTFESGMFKNIEKKAVSKGNFLMLFTDWGRAKKYLCCILIGAVNWFVIGVLVSLAPEFGGVHALAAKQPLSAGDGVFYSYIGIAVGGVIAGLLSQLLRSRIKVMLLFLIISVISQVLYLSSTGISNTRFIWEAFFMGTGVGYWTIFITIAAEQFGTNIRSTVATTVPNFVRGLLFPINLIFLALKDKYGMITTAYLMMAVLTAVALLALSQLKETFNKNLDYLEEI